MVSWCAGNLPEAGACNGGNLWVSGIYRGNVGGETGLQGGACQPYGLLVSIY